ncbi:hypothetical protein MNQ96_16295 [Sphingopyxis granuli]|uniref:hypothetical protein n=1 Tax=Sphingopyxis granuli TaxID=267128 RepID=UPI001F532178|nr:hypothetical protein [Sphingopyxis granuli]UNK79082.1 hypothetical protein MNQ96_16295 [Sphingopyxis granuli]
MTLSGIPAGDRGSVRRGGEFRAHAARASAGRRRRAGMPLWLGQAGSPRHPPAGVTPRD